MTATEKPKKDFDLLAKIRDIDLTMQTLPDYTSLKFPMINLDETVDIGWLLGLETRDEKDDLWYISQARQQTKFKMNQKGARVKSAVAMAVMRGISTSTTLELVIDQPFFLWIQRRGLSLPVFAAYLDETVWEDPGDLDF